MLFLRKLLGPCRGVVVDGVRVESPGVPETDGISVGCEDVLVTNSTVVNGDDGIVLKGAAKDVLVEGCRMASGPAWIPPTSGGNHDSK
eukprot:scaffold405206_cov32-Prasinocladus_malaysianus.AAC.1